MKKMSVRLKITLWFSAALIIVTAVTFVIILGVSRQVIQKSVRDSLIETVENNVDEVEYFLSLEDINAAEDIDHYVTYGSGYLEIDDDFLDAVNGVYTALYDSAGNMLYGENPVSMATSAYELSNSVVRTLKSDGTIYYIFDKELQEEGLEGLWLRGVVSETQGNTQLAGIFRMSILLLPILLIISIAGGYIIAGRLLLPVKKMTETAERITKGNDLNRRIELKGGSDELNRLADSFNSMLERMEKAFEGERRFTSDASHELRTPVSVIMAQCEYTLGKKCRPEEYVRSLEVINRQAEKMNALVNDMLTFTRLELNAEKYEKTLLDYTNLVKEVCKDMSSISDKGISLTCEAPKNIFVNANKKLLARLLENLISNAYKYGKEHGYVHVSLTDDNECALLSVEDNGVGIADDEQGKIFQRFYRSDASRTQEGTGLGLSIAAEIAAFHGGSITVKSTVGVGSTFVFAMPVSKPAPAR